MKLITYDGIRYLLSSVTEEAVGEFHRQLPQIKADIAAMKATQFFPQKNWHRKGGWSIKERFGEVTVTYHSKIEKKKKKKKLKDEEEFTLQFPVPVIDAFNDNYDLLAFDISKNYLTDVCPVIPRYKEIINGNTEIDIHRSMGTVNYRVSDMMRADDDIMDADWSYESDYSTEGYYPHYPDGSHLEWPIWWACAFCGGFVSECLPTDFGYRGAYDYSNPEPEGSGVYAYFGGFAGPNYEKCPESRTWAVWWNHYSICAPSNTIRRELGVGSVIGANSWTSQERIISIDVHAWRYTTVSFYAFNTGTEIRAFDLPEDCYYHSWADNLDHWNPVSFTSKRTISAYSDPNLVSGAVWTAENKYIYLWYTADISGEYYEEETRNDMTKFIAGSSFGIAYPQDLWPPINVYVTLDDGQEYLIFERVGYNVECTGYTAIYDFHGRPFYMYSAWVGEWDWISSYINSECCYGFVYAGEHHRLIFPGIDYEKHLFIAARYISPTGIERPVTFNQDQYANLIGFMQFRGAKFSSTELRERR